MYDPDVNKALEAYAAGPDMLKSALAGLSGEDLDRPGIQGGWTIREIVHHLADTDVRQTNYTKVALVSSGSTIEFDWHPGNRSIARSLGYGRLPVEPSLTLFRANREHFSRILRAIPPAWDYYINVKESREAEGYKVTVAEWVEGMARHLQEHLQEIAEIRKQWELRDGTSTKESQARKG